MGKSENDRKIIGSDILVFATDNQNKVNEIRKLAGDNFKFSFITKAEAGINEEIEENGKTILENAMIKADYIKSKYGFDCFSEDTGLIVDALNGEPGVYSARYAGQENNAENNIKKLLENLEGQTNRSAKFQTVIALNINKKQYIFEGEVTGEIIQEKQGSGGFGYDPVFMPTGYDKTFAELGLEIKNSISHRGKAVRKLMDFLENYNLD